MAWPWLELNSFKRLHVNSPGPQVEHLPHLSRYQFQLDNLWLNLRNISARGFEQTSHALQNINLETALKSAIEH